MTTLKNAINSETSTNDGQKTAQLAFLTSQAQDLTQSELEAIMGGNIENSEVTLHTVHEVRDLMTYRIHQHLPILPFSGLAIPDDPKPLIF